MGCGLLQAALIVTLRPNQQAPRYSCPTHALAEARGSRSDLHLPGQGMFTANANTTSCFNGFIFI